MSTKIDKKSNTSKKAFDQKTYDNVGLRYKRGIKNIVGYIAPEENLTVSDVFRLGLEKYIQDLKGKNIIKNIENDIDMLLRVVHRPELPDTRYYVYKKDFSELLELRDRAEKNCKEEVISEAAFKNLFTLADKPLEKLGKIVAKSDESDIGHKKMYMISCICLFIRHINNSIICYEIR